MCSELFRIPLDWLNAPVMGTFSWAMLLALAIGVGIVKLLVWGRRSNRSADAWAYVPGLVIVATALLLIPRLFPALPVRGYGVMVLLGSVVGLTMAAHRAQQMQLPVEIIYSLAFGMFICGIIGARLFFVIEYWETRFQLNDWRQTFIEVIKFTEGGLVIYGAFIGATLSFLYFSVRRRISPLALADLIAPSLLAGLAFGRIGCLLNGCCYGGESTLPWAVTFPQQSMPYQEQIASGRTLGFKLVEGAGDDARPVVSIVDAESAAAASGMRVGMRVVRINGTPTETMERAHQALFAAFGVDRPVSVENQDGQRFELRPVSPPPRSLPVHPTQIYSAVHAALLAWVLWSFYPLRRRDGEVIALMLTVYPISRFLLEIIRIDESAVFGTGLSISQNLSVVLLAGALALWVYLRRQAPHRAIFAEFHVTGGLTEPT